MRAIYAVIGAVVGLVVDILVNLLAAVIQARTPADQFADWSIGWLIGLIVTGLLMGLWLGKELLLKPKTQSGPGNANTPARPIKIRRLKALLSYGRLRGQGIELSDILLVASMLDVKTDP